MADCWNEDPDARPTFDHLHEVMTGFLQEEVTINIIQSTPDLLVYPCHLKKRAV